MSDLKTFRIKRSWLNPYLDADVDRGKTDFETEKAIQEDGISEIAPESITKLEEQLQLTFLPDALSEGNVCLANSSEVRDDFKNVFNLNDLKAYCLAILHLPCPINNPSNLADEQFFDIFYPKNTTVFWKMVAMGHKLKNILTSTRPNKNLEKENILREIATFDFTKS